MIKVYALTFTVILSLFQVVNSQVLGTMEVSEVEQPGLLINTHPDRAMLVVHTEIANMSYATNNRGVIEKKTLERGLDQLLLYPGTHIITFSTEGFQAVDFRIYIPEGKVKEVQVKVINQPAGGKGHIKIESNPPGASIILNNVPLIPKAPAELKDQFVGKQTLRLELPGYFPLDTMVTIEKNKTASYILQLQKEFANLKVTSEPGGANVYFDGELVGTTPLSKNLNPSDGGALLVQKEGYVPFTQNVPLLVGKANEYSVNLVRQTGSISISANQPGAGIFFDGEFAGVYQGIAVVKEKIALGPHTIYATLEGFDCDTVTVEVIFNKLEQVNLQLVSKPGALFVMSTPTGANIFLDGQDSKQKTPFKFPALPSGKHDLLLKLNGYEDLKKTITVTSDKTETITETLKAMVSPASQQVVTKPQVTPQTPVKKEPTFTQEKKPKKNRTWLYVGGGAVIAGGAAYFLISKGADESNTGTLVIMVPQNP
jgi:hypothetical protein